VRPWMVVVFGLLVNSSFGLYVRQNEWSDHYVQTVGTFAVSMFLFHREFHDPVPGARFDAPWVALLCVAVAGNGVVTGHPGFWPISLFVWSATLAVCATSGVFRGQVVRWLRQVWVGAGVLGAASLLTVGVVAADLLTELGAEFGEGRLARTQGLFGTYAFGGFYGLTPDGSLPQPLKQLIATVLATVLMPFFIVSNRILPKMFGASGFFELTRVEFSGALVLVALAFAWRGLGRGPLRLLFGRLVLLQALVWCFVFASSRDLLPTTVAASGTWMAVPILLVFNVFLTFVLLANVGRRKMAVRGLGVLNLVLAGVWLLFQLSVISFGPEIQIPDRHISWFRVADAFSETEFLQESVAPPGRVVIINANFYNLIGFVALGVPVVSPSNPKIRDARQLVDDSALNFGIETSELKTVRDVVNLESRLSFLGVEKLIVGSGQFTLVGSEFESDVQQIQLSLTDEDVRGLAHGPMRSMEVLSMHSFPAFMLERRQLSELGTCPIWEKSCAWLGLSLRVEPREVPRLQRCEKGCLWTFDTPAVAGSRAVIVPVTFDEALRVRDGDGTRVETVNAGGFLGVYADRGLPATRLTVELDPDPRMVSRVVVSYANLTMVLALLAAVIYAGVVARRRDDTN